MHHITFISTTHKEIGKCNPEELCRIIGRVKPEVVFLEALNDTYSKYEQNNFEQFGVLHGKLEIAALQLYDGTSSFAYVPILYNGLTDAFEKKCELVYYEFPYKGLLDQFNNLASRYGFSFLNSKESIELYEEMRLLGDSLITDATLNAKANEDIDAYENNMLQNIYAHCRERHFDNGIFMCGVAHRKSMIEKFKQFNLQETLTLDWIVYEEC